MSARKAGNVPASVKQRLLNLARDRSEDFNFMLIRYTAERLLYRLSRSRFSGDFVLKGAMLFHLGPGRLHHRPTRDLDLLGTGAPDPERLARIFREICRVTVVDDGLFFDGRDIRAERIREEREYKGVRMRLEGGMGPACIPVQVDVGFGDAVTPPPRRGRLEPLLEFPAPRLRICPWETVIAEKLQALVDLGMANSRMKDFFDLHRLASTLAIDGRSLVRAIRATFTRRRTPFPAGTPTGLSAEFALDPVKRVQWRAFIFRLRSRTGSREDSLNSIIGALRSFLMPPLVSLSAKRPFKKKWPPGGPWR